MLTEIVFLFAAFIFLIAFATMSALYYQVLATRVKPDQCPQIRGEFAVISSQKIPPLSDINCPQGGQCRFIVKDITGAIKQCNSQPDICRAFTITPTSNGLVMDYVDPESLAQTQIGTDLYIRQT